MSDAHVDVERSIRLILREAERKFDAKILELAPPEERSTLVVVQSAPSAYAWGQIVAAFNEGLNNFAVAFSAGMQDYRNGVRR